MRAALALLVAVAGAGCLRQTAFRCDLDADCGNGTCEPVGYCSFVDDSCPDGRRYGDLSGPHAGACVGTTDIPDAGVDASTDAEVDAVDAMIDAPANPDLDGDGILNAADNCPMLANANQNNEDGDALGDVCDPCPVSTNNADGDGDGVGDDCDPRPQTAGDVIALFEGFKQGIPAGWNQNSTPWTAQTGAGEITAGGQSGAFTLISTTYVPMGQETISTSVIPTAFQGARNSVGVVTNRAPAASQIICSPARTNGTETLSVYDPTNVPAANSVAYEIDQNQTYVVRLRRESPNYTCNATRGTTSATVMRNHSPIQNPFTLGLVTFGASARFQWVMVVRNP